MPPTSSDGPRRRARDRRLRDRGLDLPARPALTVALAFAAILAVGRVAIGFHYPSDVIAGAALGALSAWLLWWAPLRTRLHALAGWVGGLLDAAARRVVGVSG